MKKTSKIILSIVLFLTFATVANAKNVFQLDWSTSKYTLENIYTGISDYSIRNAEYKDGYITTVMDSNNNWTTYINYYDKEGNLIIQSDILKSSVILDLIVKNNYIYALVDDDASIYLLQMNQNLDDLENIYQIPSNYYNGLKSMLYSEIPFFGIHLLSVDDDGNAYIVTVDYDMLMISTDNQLTYIYYDETKLSEQFTDLMKLDKYLLDDVYYYTLKSNKSHIVLGGINPNDCLFKSNTCDYDSTGIITLQDINSNELWTKEYTDYKEFINTIFVGNYIVTIGIKELDDQSSSDIVVIDLDGNIVQTIKNDNSYYYLTATSNGFMITNYSEEYNNGNDGLSYIDNVTITTEVYQLFYDIETKISGKGTIETIEQAGAGDNITFTVNPEKGYVLDKVVVTDKAGNKITFTDYTFTMPSYDVTIEVTFVPENPDTEDIAIIACIAIIICGIIGTIYSIRKIRWLNS